MKLFAILLVVHGLIHLLGFAKAFELAELPQLTQPIAPSVGVLWLIAALLFLAGAGSLLVWPRWWWAVGACAIVVSMSSIVFSWSDAKFGAVANLVALVGVVFGFLAQGPASLRAAFDRDVDGGLARTAQYNFLDEPARLFYLNGSMFMMPVQGYHRYVGSSATMRVKAAALVPVVETSGEEMSQDETVTMFNDMCVMAPATLIDPAIVWEPVDACTARASFTNAGHTIRAELLFNEAGELTNFRSDDRYQTSADGGSARRVRWA